MFPQRSVRMHSESASVDEVELKGAKNRGELPSLTKKQITTHQLLTCCVALWFGVVVANNCRNLPNNSPLSAGVYMINTISSSPLTVTLLLLIINFAWKSVDLLLMI